MNGAVMGGAEGPPPDDADGVCGGVKHAGKRFSEVFVEDFNYVRIFIDKMGTDDPPRGWCKGLAEYGLKASLKQAAQPQQATAPPLRRGTTPLAPTRNMSQVAIPPAAGGGLDTDAAAAAAPAKRQRVAYRDLTDQELTEHVDFFEKAVVDRPDLKPLEDCLAMALFDQKRRAETQTASNDWTVMNKFKVGNVSANPEWSNKTFEEVYETADPKVWQWMLKPSFNATAKWCSQFVTYVKNRSTTEGKNFVPEPTARDIEAARVQANSTRD